MRGTIVLDNDAGRALRRKTAAVHARNVLDCAGGFRSGDGVYITFRAVDGGQSVIATAVACCDASDLMQKPDALDVLVVREQDVRLLWP